MNLPLVLPTGTDGGDVPRAPQEPGCHTDKGEEEEELDADRIGMQLRNVYITGLPPHFTSKDLRELVAPFGPVKTYRCCCMPRQHMGVADASYKGYGFVLFYSEESAAACIAKVSKKRIAGRRLTARYCKAAALPEGKPPQLADLPPEVLRQEAKGLRRSHTIVSGGSNNTSISRNPPPAPGYAYSTAVSYSGHAQPPPPPPPPQQPRQVMMVPYSVPTAAGAPPPQSMYYQPIVMMPPPTYAVPQGMSVPQQNILYMLR
ncbi:RNA-binding protein [Strigomonas culicis]|uniref:RNA-binding protein n=1 Tax=Strigomonas culicis TaxID=28005 RepID=S9TIU5_9TRYP|nr:RNA-binding protein [Strigomonas culicis]|eukprot:EPY18002.1 RNA-binding protein [Strigomonas culicis]